MFTKVGDPQIASVTSAEGWEDSSHPSPPRVSTFEEVQAASQDYFHGDDLAANTWATKYALQNSRGEYLEKTPTDMHWRLAGEFARIESKYPNPLSKQEIFDLFDRFRYVVPQGSPMSAVGNPYKLQSASNCFVIDPPKDSYGGLLRTDEEEVQIMKRRGGVGFDISSIRPQGLPTANAAQTTDGIGLFMQRFSNTCREVAQGGGRRGALMMTVDVHHPDIRTFIHIKEDLKKVTGANISIRLSDEFLQAVKDQAQVCLRWPCDKTKPAKIERWVDANELWLEICQAARDCAEPGLLLWDNILRESPADCYADEGYATSSTNPCAELPLSPGDSCRLMVINLIAFVKKAFLSGAKFDWQAFEQVAKKAQRLMDDLVDLELEKLAAIQAKIGSDPEPGDIKQVEQALWARLQETCRRGRRTGLGITALGDVLAMLGLRYGSDESIAFVEELYKRLAMASYTASIEMAEERGSFEVWNLQKEIDHPYLTRVISLLPSEVQAKYRMFGRRNIANLTTAPTGSVSLLTQTSSGIEPVFKALYVRRKKINGPNENARVDFVDAMGDRWTEFVVRHHGLVQWQKATGKNDTNFKESPYWGAEANDLDWKERVRLQAAATRYVDHALSSTLNLPSDVTVETVQKIYMEAWESGCKGVTIYRDGCRDGVLITPEKKDLFPQHATPERPEQLRCEIHRAKIRTHESSTVHEEWIIFVGLFEGKPYEVFGGTTENITLPKKVDSGTMIRRKLKSGSKYDLQYGEEEDPMVIRDIAKVFDNPDRGWATRMISLSLRHGAPVQYVVEQLQRDKESDLFDFAKVLARVLKKYVPDGAVPGSELPCPDCSVQGSLKYQEGCLMCTSCGYSKC